MARPTRLRLGWPASGGEENGPALLHGPARGRLSGLRLPAGPEGQEQATAWEEQARPSGATGLAQRGSRPAARNQGEEDGLQAKSQRRERISFSIF